MSKQPTRRRPAAPAERRFPVLLVALAVVVVLGVIAVIATRDSGSDVKVSDSGRGENQPVTIAGTNLPEFSSSAATDPAVGQLAPELRGATFDGTPVEIVHDGSPKVITFLAHWCPHCQKEVPLLTSYLAGNQPPEGVKLYSVATNTNSGAPNYPPSSWLAKEKWPVPVLADDGNSSSARAYGLTSFPYFVAVDPTGKVVARATGELTTDAFAALMQAAAKGTAG